MIICPIVLTIFFSTPSLLWNKWVALKFKKIPVKYSTVFQIHSTCSPSIFLMAFPMCKYHHETELVLTSCVVFPFLYLQNVIQSCSFSSRRWLPSPMNPIFPKDYYTSPFNHKAHHVFKFSVSEIKCPYFIPTGTSTNPSSLCNLFLPKDWCQHFQSHRSSVGNSCRCFPQVSEYKGNRNEVACLEQGSW